VIILNLTPEIVLSVYQQGDSFIEDAIPVVRVVSVALLLMSFSTVWLNAVTGTGNTVVNLTIEAITIVLYCVYVYIVLVQLYLSVSWGWASEIVYWISMFSMAFLYMKFGNWRAKII
jgi:Na+-driven multidrug efflux pump